MPLRLITSLASLTDKQLLAKIPAGAEYNDTEEVRELLIRSVNQQSLKNALFGSVCNKGKAESICRAHLSKNPQHNFFNLILGMHSDNNEARLKYLETAALSTGPRPKSVSGAAAYELALLYKKEGKYLQAQAWMVKALLGNYSLALENFLGKRGDANLPPLSALDYAKPAGYQHPISDKQSWSDSGYALSLCTFVAAILSDNQFEFPLLTETEWYAHWHDSNKGTIEDAHMINRLTALNDILAVVRTNQKVDEQKGVAKLLHHILASDPVIYHDFFVYGFLTGIIPETVYDVVMRYFVMQMPEFANNKAARARYVDMGAYTQAKYYLNRRNPGGPNQEFYLASVRDGLDSINLLSADFNKYNVNDFADDKKFDNDKVLYLIFKLLVTKKQYGAAQKFLAKINKNKPEAAAVYDNDIFEFFKLVDPAESNVEIFELKQKILSQLVQACGSIVLDENYLNVVLGQLEKLNDDFYQLRIGFFRVVAKLKEIQLLVQAGNANNGVQLAMIIADLEKSPELLAGKRSSIKDWQSLKEKFVTSVNAQSGVGFGTASLFGEAKKLLDAISKQLIALETKANEKPKYPSIYPKLDKHPHPNEEDQLRWAMTESVQPKRTQLPIRDSAAAIEEEEMRLALEISQHENYPIPVPAAVERRFGEPAPIYPPVYQPYQALYPGAYPQLQPIAVPPSYSEPLPYPLPYHPPAYNSALSSAQYQSVLPSAPPQVNEDLLIDLSDPAPIREEANKQKEEAYQRLLTELSGASAVRVSTSQFTTFGSTSVAPPAPDAAPQLQPPKPGASST